MHSLIKSKRLKERMEAILSSQEDHPHLAIDRRRPELLVMTLLDQTKSMTQVSRKRISVKLLKAEKNLFTWAQRLWIKTEKKKRSPVISSQHSVNQLSLEKLKLEVPRQSRPVQIFNTILELNTKPSEDLTLKKKVNRKRRVKIQMAKWKFERTREK